MGLTRFWSWVFPNENEDPHFQKLSDFYSRIDEHVFALANTCGNVLIPPNSLTWDSVQKRLSWDTSFEVPLISVGFSFKAEFAADGTKSVAVPDGYRVVLTVPNISSNHTTGLVSVVPQAFELGAGTLVVGFCRGNKFYANLPLVMGG